MWRGWQGKTCVVAILTEVLQTTFIKQMRIIQNPGEDMPWSAEELTDIRRNVLRNAIECLQVEAPLQAGLDTCRCCWMRWASSPCRRAWATRRTGSASSTRRRSRTRRDSGSGATPCRTYGRTPPSWYLHTSPASPPTTYLRDDILYPHFPQETYNRRNEFHLPDCCR